MKVRPQVLSALILLGLFCSFQAQSQFILGKQKAKLTGFRLNIGGAHENYGNISPQGVYAMLKPNQTSGIDINRYQRVDNYGAETYGGYLGVDLVFNPKNALGEVNMNREIRVGMGMHIDRELMVYVGENGSNNWQDQIGLCLIENNFDLNAAYLFKTGHRTGIHLYGGPGANFSTALGNRFVFVGSADTGYYKAYGSNYVRTYAVGGVEIQLWRVSVNVEGTYGVGAQVVHNGDINFATNYRVQLSAGFRLSK